MFIELFLIILAFVMIAIFGGAAVKDADDKMGCGGVLVALVVIAVIVVMCS